MVRLLRVLIVAAAVGATSVVAIVAFGFTIVKASGSCDIANCTGPAPGVYCGSIWAHDWDRNFFCRPVLRDRRETLGIAAAVGVGVTVCAGVGAVGMSCSSRRHQRRQGT